MFALASFLGFLGGGFVTSTHELSAASKGTVVRATRFELVSPDGKPLAYWGEQDHDVVLAFTQRHGKERAVLGLDSANLPFLTLAGTDGSDRATLRLGWCQRPILAMEDENRTGRVLLGFLASDAPSVEEENWGLALGAPALWHGLASIGYFRDVDGKRRGFAGGFDEKGGHWIASLDHSDSGK